MFGYFKERKRRRQAERFQFGYDYAAGRLLDSGGDVAEELTRQTECARHFKDYDDFDRGIDKAIADFSILSALLQKSKTSAERFINTLK